MCSGLAEPERVTRADNPAQVVGAQVHAGELVLDDGAVGCILDADPSLGAALLDGVHQVEKHIHKLAVTLRTRRRLGHIRTAA